MSGKPLPKPCWLDQFEVWRVVRGERVWRNEDGSRLFTWDSLHGEIEVFDRNGWHLGAVDAQMGELIKDAKKGRRIHVR